MRNHLTPTEQARRDQLIAEIAAGAEALAAKRKEKRRIEFAGYQRAHRAKARADTDLRETQDNSHNGGSC